MIGKGFQIGDTWWLVEHASYTRPPAFQVWKVDPETRKYDSCLVDKDYVEAIYPGVPPQEWAPEVFELAKTKCLFKWADRTPRYQEALAARLDHAKAKHPEGPTFAALIEEVGEVARVLDDPSKRDEYRSELLDVATVAIRLWMKENENGWSM